MRTTRGLGLAIATALLLSACGGLTGETTTTAGSEDTTAPGGGALTGSVVVSGSSTVEPITARVGQAFSAANPGVGVTVEGPGTGDGFKRFCAGETDISDASRPIKQEEADTCAAAGIDYVELKVAYDGLSVITSRDNAAFTCLDFGDLYALLGPESEGFTTWAAANDLAAELSGAGLGGSQAPYPDAPLVITAPGEESGTYDSFLEFVIADIAEARGTEEALRADYQASPNDNVIVENISGNTTSLGFVGYAFADENKSVVKSLEVDGGAGCVAATPETISDGSYPISRPLFIYVSKNKMAANSGLVAFVDYYLSDEGIQNVSAADYIPLPSDELEATRSAWQGARG
jgi:phosphate transport system substrate-binding protein